MTHRRSTTRTGAVPALPSAPKARTLAIYTSFCTNAHHDQCRHTIRDHGFTFHCTCACHSNGQLPLAL